MGIGWRYPGRPFIATIEVQNLLNSHFHYQDTDQLNPRIVRASNLPRPDDISPMNHVNSNSSTRRVAPRQIANLVTGRSHRLTP